MNTFILISLLAAAFIDKALGDEPLICVDSNRGTCNAGAFLGFCFLNRDTGSMNCDDEEFCVSKMADLKAKKGKSGCYSDGGVAKCCCGEPDFCNHIAFEKLGKSAASSCQSLFLSTAMKTKTMYCKDPWCVGVKFQMAGSSGEYRTCQSMISRLAYDKATNPEVYKVERTLVRMKCDDVIGNYSQGSYESEDGICVNLSDTIDGMEVKGKYCCCRGADKCNEKETMNLFRGLDEPDTPLASGSSRLPFPPAHIHATILVLPFSILLRY